MTLTYIVTQKGFVWLDEKARLKYKSEMAELRQANAMLYKMLYDLKLIGMRIDEIKATKKVVKFSRLQYQKQREKGRV